MDDLNNSVDINDITELGNPAKPSGNAGKVMLTRMNDTHYEITSWVLDLMELDNYDSVMDVGCGSGLTLRRIAERITGTGFTGLDYSMTAIKLSESTNAEFIKEGRSSFIQASVEKIPIEDNVFTKVISVESFYFWPDHVENLKEIKRVMKDGGKIFVACDIYDSPDLTEHEKDNIKKYNLFNPSLDEYERIFKDAGFRDVKINTKEGTTWVCAQGTK